MPRPRAEAEETPKSRGSKYTKRTPSMYGKAESFAIDTDVQMMLLLTVSRDGYGMSFGAGERRSLEPFMSLIRGMYPDGKHRFLEKKKVNRFWRVVGNEPMYASPGKGKSGKVTANKRTRATAQNSTVSRLEELGNVESLEPNNGDRTSDALGESSGESIGVVGGTRNLPLESPGNPPDVGSGPELADLDGEPDEAILEKLLESNPAPDSLDETSGMSSGVMRNTDLMEDECNVIDFDAPGQSGRPTESVLAETSTSLQDHNSQSSGDVGSVSPTMHQWRPGMDLRRLILDWRWVFGPHATRRSRASHRY